MSRTIIRNTPFEGAVARTQEAIASSAITPGHLIEYGGTNDVQAHSTAAGPAQGLFAIEGFAGQGIDDAYASGQGVLYVAAGPGWVIQALLASGQTVTRGAALVSAGDGTLRAAVGDGTEEVGIVAYAGEAVDATGGATRINVEVA